MNQWASETDQIREVTAYNGTGGTIPAYAVLELVSYSIGSDDEAGRFLVMAPTRSSQTTAIVFNGPVALPAGSWGVVTMDLPNWAAVDPGSAGSGIGSGSGIADPAAGEEWGVLAGSFYLQPDQFGFRVLGYDSDAVGDYTSPRVMVVKVDAGDEGDTGSGSGSGDGVYQYHVDCNNGNPIVTRVA